MEESALAAWMRAIGRDGWRAAAPDSAADSAPDSAPDLSRNSTWGDRFDALAAFQEQVAEAAAKGARGAGTTRERLFDGLMQGFDALQAERAAVLAIWKSRDPGVAALIAGRAGWHLRRLALAAGVDVSGVRGQLRLAALAALLLKAFGSWRLDESADMAATMAELDRLLDKAERAETRGVSADVIGLPGLTVLGERLSALLPFGRRGGEANGRRGGSGANGDPVAPPSPGPPAE